MTEKNEEAKATQEVKRRRIKGTSLGNLRALMKKMEKTVKELNSFRDLVLDAHCLFADQVNWNTGVIYDTSDKVKDREQIGRIEQTEASKNRKLIAAMEEIDQEIGDLKWELSEKIGCLPADIDPSSGEIRGTPVIGIDPDEPAPAEVEAPAPVAATCEINEGDEKIVGGPIPFKAQ